MGTQVAQALAALRNLGTTEEIRALADDGFGPPVPPAVNAHIHLPPNFSAFESVEQAIDLASQQEIGVLGVSNYYDYEVYGDFVERARAHGIFPLFGLEIILDAGGASRVGGSKQMTPATQVKLIFAAKASLVSVR